ncbi:MAG: Clp protease N-terminal domain-containing protein [Evtepia gabavorous]
MKTVTFTAHAQGSLGAAGALSQRLGHDYVGSEHLLLGLLQESRSTAARILSAQGLTRRNLQNLLVTALGTGTPLACRRPLTPAWNALWRPPWPRPSA